MNERGEQDEHSERQREWTYQDSNKGVQHHWIDSTLHSPGCPSRCWGQADLMSPNSWVPSHQHLAKRSKEERRREKGEWRGTYPWLCPSGHSWWRRAWGCSHSCHWGSWLRCWQQWSEGQRTGQRRAVKEEETSTSFFTIVRVGGGQVVLGGILSFTEVVLRNNEFCCFSIENVSGFCS